MEEDVRVEGDEDIDGSGHGPDQLFHPRSAGRHGRSPPSYARPAFFFPAACGAQREKQEHGHEFMGGKCALGKAEQHKKQDERTAPEITLLVKGADIAHGDEHRQEESAHAQHA